MIKRIFIIVSLFISVSIIVAYAQDETDLKNRIEQYQKKLTELRQQKTTLASEIQYMDTQIYLTGLRIQATEQKIETTQKEINILSSRIEGLDNSLSYLSKLLLKRIVAGYKKRSFPFLNLLLNSQNANDLINRFKYLKIAQDDNQKLLLQVQTAKLNFEEQKKLREQKKIELDRLNRELTNQKNDLDRQKIQKQKLLTDTQNDEATYQRLLTQAQQQLASFKSFVQSSGANTIIEANGLGLGSDNSYYSQRDARWANQGIGYSSETILNVGCLLTSVSIVLKKNNVDINPSSIANNPSYFWANTAYMNYRWTMNPWPNGLSSYHITASQIDEELNNNHYVIVGIGYSSCNSSGGDHFVVLIKKDGNDYIMHDPIYGPDLKFSSHYSLICSAETFK